MFNTRLLLLGSIVMLSGCATTTPVAVSCPPPPPAPEILTLPASAGPSLIERYQDLLNELRLSLEKAQKQ